MITRFSRWWLRRRGWRIFHGRQLVKISASTSVFHDDIAQVQDQGRGLMVAAAQQLAQRVHDDLWRKGAFLVTHGDNQTYDGELIEVTLLAVLPATELDPARERRRSFIDRLHQAGFANDDFQIEPHEPVPPLADQRPVTHDLTAAIVRFDPDGQDGLTGLIEGVTEKTWALPARGEFMLLPHPDGEATRYVAVEDAQRMGERWSVLAQFAPRETAHA